MAVPLLTPIQYVKGVGPRKARILERLGIRTVEDALLFQPFRYEDRTHIYRIAELVPDRFQTVEAVVKRGQIVRLRGGRGRSLFDLHLSDGTGRLKARFFNQPYLRDTFEPGCSVLLSGRVGGRAGRPEMLHPEFELLSAESRSIHAGRIVPIYHLTRGIGQKTLRGIQWRVVERYADDVPEILPPELLARRELLPLPTALRAVHFPPAGSSLEELRRGRTAGHRRLAYEQALLLQLAMSRRRVERLASPRARSYDVASPTAGKLKTRLPFRLTGDQVTALKEILADLDSPHTMNRLLQGEVGSGKTLVALFAMLVAADSGVQAALMAPTEVLAEQHRQKLSAWLEGIGPEPVLLTAAVKGRERKETLEAIASGRARLVLGTHALLQESVEFADLGLVVVDEQHRFGVIQRAALGLKGGDPDVLVMTATPIPRSLALTVFGDLDVSTLRQLPAGRKPVRTVLITPQERSAMWEQVGRELRQGRQAFVICPLIEESERTDLRAAEKVYRELKERTFPDVSIGLLHGRIKPEERERVMWAFSTGKLSLLVATTVVEVGVDVAGATVMVVEHADRFGLAQLHQLRGRVGRGDRSAVCYLTVEGSVTEEAERRLRVMARTNDGFEIAEEDLAIRGPGEFLGIRQSGVPEAALLGILRAPGVLEDAREDARRLTAQGWDLPPQLAEAVERRWSHRWELGSVG